MKGLNDIYEKQAYDYDEFGRIEAYFGSEKVFFEQLFAANHVQTVLDYACGTGPHLYMLSQAFQYPCMIEQGRLLE